MTTLTLLRPVWARPNVLAAGLAAAIAAGTVAPCMAAPQAMSNGLRKFPDDQSLTAILRGAWSHNPVFAALGAARTSASHPASASPIAVTSCADDGTSGTLRDAVGRAADGDVIDLSGLTCSQITLTNGAIVSPVLNLTLRGPGVSALTIDGGNAARVAMGGNLTISDLTIAHGAAFDNVGGGCLFANGDLTLDHAKVTGCLAVSVADSVAGGAVVALGDLLLHDTLIAGNRVTANDAAGGGGALVGGAVALYDSTIASNVAQATQGRALGGGIATVGGVTLLHSVLGDNTVESTDGAAYGGGVHVEGSSDISIVDRSTVSGNTARSQASWSYGGGVNSGAYAAPMASIVFVHDSTISGNRVESACTSCVIGGGGVHAMDGIQVSYATVSDNHAVCASATTCRAGGGGLSSYGGLSTSTIELRNATLSGNEAIGGTSVGALGFGGGLVIASGQPFLAFNSTIAFNHASHFGGGAVAQSSMALPSILDSTIVAENASDAGSDDLAAGPVGNSLAIQGFKSLVVTAGTGVALPGDTIGDDPQLQPLADNGGYTATHALATGSHAIDAGINTESFACDQRGYPYRRVVGAAADIGAFELLGERPLFADNFDGTVDCPP